MIKRILITGGAGFIGSTCAQHFLNLGYEVAVLDSFIRKGVEYNLKRLKGGQILRGDIRFDYDLEKVGKVDAVIHTAANPGIRWSMLAPKFDFDTNALGTLNVLEFAKRLGGIPVIYCSTNKVYDGDKVNAIPTKELATRYEYASQEYKNGIPVDFSVDGADHSCYGVSKLSGDLYCQEYSRNLGVPAVINRMSCIGGAWQFGVQDQGWIAWFVFAAITGKTINICGDGKQVRDILDVQDLVRLFEIELKNIDKHQGNVYNVGGGAKNTLSLIECINYLKQKINRDIPLKFHPWRVADHRVYVSDLAKLKKYWQPETTAYEVIDKIYEWAMSNPEIVALYENDFL